MQKSTANTLNHDDVIKLVSHITLSLLDIDFEILVEKDKRYSVPNRYMRTEHLNNPQIFGRTYIQLKYKAPCTKTGLWGEWKSDKIYLSSYMTEDEVVKKVFVLFKRAVEHEIMEGFKFDGKIVFNPHTSFRDLLQVSEKEITRK